MDNKREGFIGNQGFVAPDITNDNYVLGGGMLPDEILAPDGQWDAYLPSDEKQDRPGVLTYNCTGFGTSHAVVTLIKKKFGIDDNYSERFLGIAAGTQPPGNDPHIVAEAWRKQGAIPETMLPFDQSITTVPQYYSPKPLTPDLISWGQVWLTKYDFLHEYVYTSHSPNDKNLLMQALKHSPLGVAVYAWAQNEQGLYYRPNDIDNHWCSLYGYVEGQYWKIFDSADQTHKKLVWDFEFGYPKRYYVEEKPEFTPTQKKTLIELLQNLVESLLRWVQSLKKNNMSMDRTIKIANWAAAIKRAEGWQDIPPSKSFRNNNPGNLKYAQQAGTIRKDEQGLAVFASYAYGWQALLRQLDIATNGQSNVYSPDMTLKAFTMKYTDLKEGIELDNYLARVTGAMNCKSEDKIKNIV